MDVCMYGCVHTNFKGAKTEARSKKKQATESNTKQATRNKQQTRKVKINTVLCYHTHSQVFVELALLIGVDSTGCLVKYSELRAVEVQPRLGRSAIDQPKKWGDRTRKKTNTKSFARRSKHSNRNGVGIHTIFSNKNWYQKSEAYSCFVTAVLTFN